MKFETQVRKVCPNDYQAAAGGKTKSKMAADAILNFGKNAAISLLFNQFSPNFAQLCIACRLNRKAENRKWNFKFKMAAAAILKKLKHQ